MLKTTAAVFQRLTEQTSTKRACDEHRFDLKKRSDEPGATSFMGRLADESEATQSHKDAEYVTAENELDDNECNCPTLIIWNSGCSGLIIASDSFVIDQSPQRTL